MKRVRIQSTRRGIRRLKRLLEDPRERLKIAEAGVGPIAKAAQNTVPVGSKSVREYAPRIRKGKRNRPSRITRIRQAGNLRMAHDMQPTSFGLKIGPRVRPGAKSYAVYAPIIHSKNPWLRKAMSRS